MEEQNQFPDPDVGSRVWNSLCQVENGIAVRVDNRPLNWKTDSKQRPTDDYLAWAGYYGYYVEDTPEYDENTQRLVIDTLPEALVDEENKTVTVRKYLINLTPEEVEEKRIQDEINLWTSLRIERNNKLKLCDWTQLLDIDEATKLQWQNYRQMLRDLPQNTVDPANPEWPTSPEDTI